MPYFCPIKNDGIMQTKLFFRLLLSFILLITNHNIQAQTGESKEAEIKFIVEGSKCSSNRKAKVTAVITAVKEGDIIDDSEAVYKVYKGAERVNTFSEKTFYLPPAVDEYIIYAEGLLCNNRPVAIRPYDEVLVTLESITITKAEYKRCSASDISVSVAVSNGSENGTYTYKLIDGNNVIKDTTLSAKKDVSFPAKTSSSDLKIEVIDNGCSIENFDVEVLETTSILEPSIIEGNTTVCKYDDIKLSVKSVYSGNKFAWKKGDKLISENSTMEIPNATEEHEGEYSFSMTFDGCDNEYSETFTVKLNVLPKPNVPAEPQYICFNSGEISLNNSKYASPTSDTHTLVWYRADNTLIDGTPKFNSNDPNLIGTREYLVSQKNSTGCESAKTKLTIIVENLPAKAGGNIIFCTSNDSKPTIRIIKAGNYTYNLYTEYAGSNPIGSGTAVNDTVFIKTNPDLVVGNTYYLETQNIHGCVSSERTTISPIEDSWIFGTEKVCYGDNLSLSAGYTGGKIVWTKPDGSNYNGKELSIDSVKFSDAGTYSLLIEEPGLSCTMRDEIQVTITQPAPPTVVIDSFRYVPTDTPSAMTASTTKNDFTLKWYDPDGKPISGQSPKPVINEEGVFVYHVSQDSSGCESPRVPVTVIVGKVPASVPVSDINICIADKPVIQIRNTTRDYKYTVYYKNEIIAEEKGNGGNISLTSNVSISENTELAITVSDIYGISSARTTVNLISVNNLIDLQNSTLSVCDGSTGKLTAVDITGASYVWTTPGGMETAQTITVPDASNADAGRYTLAVTTPGCTVAEHSIELKVEKLAKPAAQKEIYYCTGAQATKLTATALQGYKLVWFDESQTQLQDAPTPNTSVAGTSLYYVLQMSTSDENCLSDQETITVIVEDKPEAVVLDPVNICVVPGDTKPVSVRIPDSSEGYIYRLYSRETGGSIVGNATSAGDGLPVDITINDSEAVSGTTYYLEITNKTNCVSDRTPVEIVITEITLSPDELPPYQINEFYSQRLTTTVSGSRYEVVQGYLPVGFTLSSMGDISGTATEYADPFVFTVEVTNSLGCSIKKEYTLKSELLVSKMFSPNGDGINDTFMKGYKVIIFDCIGRKLFSGDDGWDGIYNGKIAPEDVYYYILYYKDKDGKERRVTSYVTLIKTI
jgi:gliding motility-associated-like protein